MADETPGEEDRSASFEGEQQYGEQDKYIYSTTPESLVSDFCRGEHEEEEITYEQEWVCEPQEGEEGYVQGEWEIPGEELRAEEEEVAIEKRISLDSEYLKSVLGTPLTFALLDVALKRPSDPIQYLGAFLLKWRTCKYDTVKHYEKMKELDAKREAYRERIREIRRQEMLDQEEKEEELRRGEKEESSIEADDDLGEAHELDLQE